MSSGRIQVSNRRDKWDVSSKRKWTVWPHPIPDMIDRPDFAVCFKRDGRVRIEEVIEMSPIKTKAIVGLLARKGG